VVSQTSGLLDRLRSVEDPELPVSIVDLGMVKGIVENEDGYVVTLIPTFLGCPAQMFIEQAVREALADEGRTTKVLWSTDGWSLADVSDLGRLQLRDFGLAVPDERGDVTCPHCDSDRLVVEGDWGSTLCRKLAYCPACQTPVEVMKGPLTVPVVLRRLGARR
jgi:ring-1,2-phenylacetyl-CoA epoxidase subunit PaaD